MCVPSSFGHSCSTRCRSLAKEIKSRSQLVICAVATRSQPRSGHNQNPVTTQSLWLIPTFTANEHVNVYIRCICTNYDSIRIRTFEHAMALKGAVALRAPALGEPPPH
eukprot:7517295-Pyramimonas_sp.AAC.1